MGEIGFKTKLSTISNHYYVRFDCKNHKRLNYNFARSFLVKDIFEIINGLSLTEFYSKNKTKRVFLRIGDLSYTDVINDNTIIYLSDNCIIPENKILNYDDIVLATIGATVGKVNLVKKFQGGVFSNNTVCLRVKDKTQHNPFFYEKLIRTKIIQSKIWCAVSQKAQPNLQDYDLKHIRLPFIPYELQCKLLEQTKPIENKIIELKNSKIQTINIINHVFGKALGINWEEFATIKQEKIYISSISDFANNVDCRMGIRFHNKAGAYIQSFLEKQTNKRIKDFIDQPIVLGKGVSPSDYDEEGEYYYIAMSNIKNWAFDPDDCKKVSEEYALSNLNKTVQKDDILLARSGEGTIGKVALIKDEEINGIFADFTQRIRLTGFAPLCAYYYFRSDFFQYLVYTHKKGLGNNTNIFPSQIKEFPVPDWNEKEQTDIMEAIKTQLDEQKEIDRHIEKKKQAINQIIEDAIKKERINI